MVFFYLSYTFFFTIWSLIECSIDLKQSSILSVYEGAHKCLRLQIEAGQYCTFVISSDGSVRACGKGSYGRLGLGDSNNQSTLKKLTFEPHRAIKKVSSSKGSDGHTLAFTTEGEVFSWGDGDYGKLGHGNSSTQKYPKLIQGPLQGKVWLASLWSSVPLWATFLMFVCWVFCVRWWCAFLLVTDTVLQSVRTESSTRGVKEILED